MISDFRVISISLWNRRSLLGFSLLAAFLAVFIFYVLNNMSNPANDMGTGGEKPQAEKKAPEDEHEPMDAEDSSQPEKEDDIKPEKDAVLPEKEQKEEKEEEKGSSTPPPEQNVEENGTDDQAKSPEKSQEIKGKGAEKGAMLKTDSQAMAAIDREEDPVEDLKEVEWPKTLEGFKYGFNEEGELRHIETDEGFTFKIKEDHSYNQKRYETIGELITDHVYGLLESQCHLKRQYIPKDSSENDPRSFFFMSEDALTNEDKLMILIHGSGVVRAGQWARRLIMNDNLEKGTQIAYIERAMKEGYGVIVLNSNLNYAKKGDKEVKIKGSENPEKHALYVWKHFVSTAAAKHIAIVAHSYGGVVATDLAVSAKKFFPRVFAIAFTDSVHSLIFQDAPNDLIKFYKKNAINWVTSDEPLDTPMKHQPKKDAKRLSAGHQKHEWTSSSCMESAFKFFTDKYAEALNPTADDAKSDL